LSSLIDLLKSNQDFETVLVNTGQHKELIDDSISAFNFKPDINLGMMSHNQSTLGLTSLLLASYQQNFSKDPLDIVVVHGDTATAAAIALSAFLSGTPVAHVEAGLRTHDLRSPFPEEGNRRVIDSISTLLFAPTESAAKNLAIESPSANVYITGNTGIDALRRSLAIVIDDNEIQKRLSPVLPSENGTKMILVTQHRRENFGQNLNEVLKAVIELTKLGFHVVLPSHPNPNVQNQLNQLKSELVNVKILGPLPYLDFLFLMTKSDLIITDSGGIQEEAVALGIPTIITRESTERPEAISSGVGELVTMKSNNILEAALRRLSDVRSSTLPAGTIQNLDFGNGYAGKKIYEALCQYLKSKNAD
jgi:UDP-N-acetylglucosamine 2-epimerase (non-hydrolysing)